jgi:hypothetical protein
MSTDTEVWTGELVDVAALLPEPDRWQRHDLHHAALGDFTCWQFENRHRHWNVTVCSPEALDGADLDPVAVEEVKRLLPQVRYRISINMEPINPERSGWEFLNRVITAVATGSHGLGFDVFTGAPIR